MTTWAQLEQEWNERVDPSVTKRLRHIHRQYPAPVARLVYEFSNEFGPRGKRAFNWVASVYNKAVKYVLRMLARGIRSPGEEDNPAIAMALSANDLADPDGVITPGWKWARSRRGSDDRQRALLVFHANNLAQLWSMFLDPGMRDVLDWIEAEQPDLMSMDYEEAHEATRAWHEEMRVLELDMSRRQGHVIWTDESGWTLQDLVSREQLEAEGDAMGHCVGGYWKSVQKGDTQILSLRDPKGHPHVTIEVETSDPRPEVVQVQGKQNERPKPEYGERALRAVEEIGIGHIGPLESCMPWHEIWRRFRSWGYQVLPQDYGFDGPGDYPPPGEGTDDLVQAIRGFHRRGVVRSSLSIQEGRSYRVADAHLEIDEGKVKVFAMLHDSAVTAAARIGYGGSSVDWLRKEFRSRGETRPMDLVLSALVGLEPHGETARSWPPKKTSEALGLDLYRKERFVFDLPEAATCGSVDEERQEIRRLIHELDAIEREMARAVFDAVDRPALEALGWVQRSEEASVSSNDLEQPWDPGIHLWRPGDDLGVPAYWFIYGKEGPFPEERFRAAQETLDRWEKAHPRLFTEDTMERYMRLIESDLS